MGPGLGMPGLLAACVCTRPSWQGLALQGSPAWVSATVAQSLLGLTGGHTQGCCQARGQHREMGASMLLAPERGSDGTRHKHLEHTCVHVCVPHRHSMGKHMAYVAMHICTVHWGCAGSGLGCSPPYTPPPCGPTGVCGCPSGWPGIAYKAGHSHKQPSAAACPMMGQEAGEYLSLARG